MLNLFAALLVVLNVGVLSQRAAAVTSANVEYRTSESVKLISGKPSLAAFVRAADRHLEAKTLAFINQKVSAEKAAGAISAKTEGHNSYTISLGAAKASIVVVDTDKNSFNINGKPVILKLEDSPEVTWKKLGESVPGPDIRTATMASLMNFMEAGACYRSMPAECQAYAEKLHPIVTGKEPVNPAFLKQASGKVAEFKTALKGTMAYGCDIDNKSLRNCSNDITQKLEQIELAEKQKLEPPRARPPGAPPGPGAPGAPAAPGEPGVPAPPADAKAPGK